EGFHLIPSQPELSLIEVALINPLSRERVLPGLLGAVAPDHDYVLNDCNPSLGRLRIHALTPAGRGLIPTPPEHLAARGARMILSTVETMRRKRLNPHLKIEGILLTMADSRASLTRDIQAAVEQQYGDDIRIFNAVVRRSVRFAESAAAGQSILAFDPRGPGANAYRAVAKEIDRGKN